MATNIHRAWVFRAEFGRRRPYFTQLDANAYDDAAAEQTQARWDALIISQSRRIARGAL